MSAVHRIPAQGGRWWLLQLDMIKKVVQRCRRQQHLTFRARHFLLLPVGLIVSHSRAAAEQGGQPALHVTILVDEEAH